MDKNMSPYPVHDSENRDQSYIIYFPCSLKD